MCCPTSRSLSSPLTRALFRALPLILCGVLLAAGSGRAGAQASTTSTTAAAHPQGFLGDVTSGGSAAQGLAADEARRLYFKSGAPAGPREVTVPPSAERKRLSQLREALVPSQAPEATLRIRALEGFLDYDEEDQIIYSPGRTSIRYGTYFIEADKVILDARLQEVQAEGNVVMTMGTITGTNDRMTADSVRYNFRNNEGVAFNASGEHSPVYFRPAHPKEKQRADIPQFQKVSQQESIFRDTKLTTCDFSKPHYNVQGREVVLFQDDRVFIRGATFYVWGVPVMYLPAYTRSLSTGSPWFVSLGTSSRAGVYIRAGYAYEHQTQEPAMTPGEELITRSAGKAMLYTDYLSKIGPGLGFDYNYKFEFGKHRGELSLYNVYDQNREVVGAKREVEPILNTVTGQPTGRYQLKEPDRFQETDRWRYYWKHRTNITENMNLTVNIDEFSDPDIFYDVLDLFSDRLEDRQRQIMRRSRIALTDVEESFVVRLMVDIRDRIGLNRINNFSNPDDNNRDFDLNPFTSIKDAKVDGISAKRWGRVSEKLPQFDFATRYLPIGNRPTYYMTDLNLYNNLDRGLNIVSRKDDAWVQGAQFYNRLLHQWKLSERYTLLGKAGFGAGTARRDSESLGIEDFTEFPTNVVQVAPGVFEDVGVGGKHFYDGVESGVKFIDDNGTFLIGRRKRNLNQIVPNYMWGDAELQLNARFSDALTGDLDWRYRQTTRDYIGDWHASLGDLAFREDLFNYPIREHWLEGGLTYRLARPIISLSSRAGLNLLPRSDLYSQEDTAFWNNGVAWSNQLQTLKFTGSVGYRQQQMYDPTDPNSYQESRITTNANIGYMPIHQRWYTQIRARYDKPLNSQLERHNDFNDLTFFTERQPDSDIKWVYGRELGPKYNAEFLVRWDEQVGGIRDVAWLLQRDMHDAVATFRIQVQKDETHATDRTDIQNQFDVRFGLKFKLPNKSAQFGQGNVKTLKDRARQPAMAY